MLRLDASLTASSSFRILIALGVPFGLLLHAHFYKPHTIALLSQVNKAAGFLCQQF